MGLHPLVVQGGVSIATRVVGGVATMVAIKQFFQAKEQIAAEQRARAAAQARADEQHFQVHLQGLKKRDDIDIEGLRHEYLMKLQKSRHEDDVTLEEVRRQNGIEAKLWPTEVGPRTIHGLASRRSVQPLVLHYFAPLLPSDDLTYQIKMEGSDAIRNFLNENGYSALSPTHPVSFFGDAPTIRSEQALHQLYNEKRDLPTALLQLDHLRDNLSLMAGCFGFAQGVESPPVLSKSGKIAWTENARTSLRHELENLKTLLGDIDDSEFNQLLDGKGAFVNLKFLGFEAKNGGDANPYLKLTPEILRRTAEVAEPGLALSAAAMADFYHWTRYGTAPRLPAILPSFVERSQFPSALGEDMLQTVLTQYASTYAYVAETDSYSAPEKLLTLAGALASVEGALGEKLTVSTIERAEEAFRKRYGVKASVSIEDYAKRGLSKEQMAFFAKLADVWQCAGNTEQAVFYNNFQNFGRLNSVEDEQETEFPEGTSLKERYESLPKIIRRLTDRDGST
jgi:hypothetical protein